MNFLTILDNLTFIVLVAAGFYQWLWTKKTDYAKAAMLFALAACVKASLVHGYLVEQMK